MPSICHSKLALPLHEHAGLEFRISGPSQGLLHGFESQNCKGLSWDVPGGDADNVHELWQELQGGIPLCRLVGGGSVGHRDGPFNSSHRHYRSQRPWLGRVVPNNASGCACGQTIQHQPTGRELSFIS